MADLLVNHGTLDTASGDLRRGAIDITTILDQMDSELAQLQSSWEGDAQAAYLTAKQQWTEGMNGMREVLDQIGVMVDGANQTYRQTDQAGANRFS